MPNERKPPKPDYPDHLLAELLELRPDIESLLADEPRSSRRFRANLEDKLQTVLLKVLRHLPGYRPHEEGLKPWVTRITCNFKHDEHRAKQCHEATFGEDHVDADFAPSIGVSPERAAQVNALASKVFAAMAEMPPALQEVLMLSAFGEKSQAEIASKLGISEDAVKMRLLRARQFLRKKVGRVEDHIGVMPVFWSLFRRAMTFFGQIVHLWPPILLAVIAAPQFEPTILILEPDNTVAMTPVRVPPSPVVQESTRVRVPNVVETTRQNAEHTPKTPTSPKSPNKSRQAARAADVVKAVDIETATPEFFVGDGL